MKCVLSYVPTAEESSLDLDCSVKLTIPKSWSASPVKRLSDLFVDTFNKKHGAQHPTRILVGPSVYLSVLVEGEPKQLNPEVKLESYTNLPTEIRVLRGVFDPTNALAPAAAPATSPSEPAKPTVSASSAARATTTETPTPAAPAAATGLVGCKRFGCKKKFTAGRPGENGPCRHHVKPPVFHETRKFWACCPAKVGWDWDSFEAIEGCAEAPEHTDVKEKVQVLGGTDLRNEQELARQAKEGPQRLEKSSLDKLMAARSALVDLGVNPAVFDQARDGIKAPIEAKGDVEPGQIWDVVAKQVAQVLEKALTQQ